MIEPSEAKIIKRIESAFQSSSVSKEKKKTVIPGESPSPPPSRTPATRRSKKK